MPNKKKTIKPPIYRSLSEYIVPHREILVIALCSMAITALILSALPVVVLQLVDNILVNMDSVFTQNFLWILLALLIAHGVVSYASTYTIHSTRNKVCIDLRAAMFSKLLSLPISRYTEMTNNDLEQRFMDDLDSGSQAIMKATTILVKDALMIVFLLAWMFYLSGEFTLFILLFLSVLLLVSQLINGYLEKTNRQMIDASTVIQNELSQSMSKYQTIRVHGGQSHETNHFKDKTQQMHALGLRQTSVKSLRNILGKIVAAIILTTIGYFLLQQAHNDKISIGGIASLLTAGVMLFLSLNQLLSANHFLQQGRQSLEKIFAFLDQESNNDDEGVSIEQLSGRLVFDKVSYFSDASAQLVIDSFSLTIKPKHAIALICTSEKEQTALINLILGIIQPTSGKILFDGHNLANLTSTSLYSNIALVTHKALLFNDTVANNIAYGTMKCTNEAKITTAAFASHSSEFIRELPQGLQTKVRDNGVQLTKAQCLHIAIARALLKNPSILIIDDPFAESTSHIETKCLQDALKKLMQGRTTLFITQQPPSLVKIDRIVYIARKKQQESNQLTKSIHSLLNRTQ